MNTLKVWKNCQTRLQQGLERLYEFRDQLAYAIFLRRVFARRLALALALGFSLFGVCIGLQNIPRMSGPDPGWPLTFPDIKDIALLLSPLLSLVSLIRPVVGYRTFYITVLVLVVLYAPELIALTALLMGITAIMLLFSRAQWGVMAVLALLPWLEYKLALLVVLPLGTALFYTPWRAFWLSLTGLLWIESIGLVWGGVSRLSMSREAILQRLEPLTLTQLSQAPWAPDCLNANSAVLVEIARMWSPPQWLIVPLLLQILMSVLVIQIVNRCYQPVRFQDRLALQYLSQDADSGINLSLWLSRAPLGVSAGALLMIILQAGLAWNHLGTYGIHLFMGDVGAALICVLAAFFHYHGDPTMPHEFSHRHLSTKKETCGSSPHLYPPIPLGSPNLSGTPAPVSSSEPLRISDWRDRVEMEWQGHMAGGRSVKFQRKGEDKQNAPSSRPEQPKSQPAPTASSNQRVAGFAQGNLIDDQYLIKQVIEGGMGTVWIVLDEFSGVTYAVKSLKSELNTSPEAVQRFTNEAKTWIRLGHHPHIVQALHYREVEKRPLLFLEYVDGTALDEVFRSSGPVTDLAELLSWSIQFCQGMHYVHTRDLGYGVVGLVHRDIKPGNILLTKQRQVKITDFGLAKAAHLSTNMTRENTGMGTLRYMSPEQLQDARNVDHRADIYSFGAVLYEGLVGQPPFTEEDTVNLYMSVLKREPARPSQIRPDLPTDLDRVVIRCLQKNPKQRFNSFEELEWTLQRLQQKYFNGAGPLRIVQP